MRPDSPYRKIPKSCLEQRDSGFLRRFHSTRIPESQIDDFSLTIHCFVKNAHIRRGVCDLRRMLFQDISRAGWAGLEVWCLSRGLQEEITPEVLLLGSLNECSRLHLAGTSNNIMSRIITGPGWLLLSVDPKP